MTKTTKAQIKKQARKEMVNSFNQLSKEAKTDLQETAVVLTVDGHMISPNNTGLLAFQAGSDEKPVPTMIGGYSQWKDSGRQVKKGSTAYFIMAPAQKKTDLPDGTQETKLYFVPVNVFDISQTEAI